MFNLTTINPTQGVRIVTNYASLTFLKHFIYRFLIISVFLVFTLQLSATIYYVSATGNDANSGTSTSLPWKTLTKVNSLTPKAGDQILFKRGDSWIGTISVKASGTSASPITYGAWGDGAYPVISGFTTITGWTNEGNGIYSKVISVESNPEIVTINGVQFAMGRTPNADRHNPQYSDYYHIDSFSGTTQITDSECNASVTNWTGAQLVVRSSNFWDWHRYLITNHSGTTLTFTNSGNDPNAAGFGYFIQNHIKTLDQFGEWYYGGGKLYMFFGNANPNVYTINVSSKDKLLNINLKSFVTIRNLKFEGANNQAIDLNSNSVYNTTIDNCDFDFNHTGIYGQWNYNTTITNCSFKRSTNTAIYQHYYVDGTYFAYNTIDSTGLVIGAGESSFYTGMGAYISYAFRTYSTKNTIIEYNTITNSGYCGIVFSGDGTIVRYNYIDNYGLYKADAGGIYTSSQTGLNNMVIDHNTVLNGIQSNETLGLPLGTVSNKQYNIYLDYGAIYGYTITNNTAAHCQGGGIMLHGSQNVKVANNTVYDCAVGIRLQELDGLGYPSRNITMDNNVVVAKTLSQLCVWARSTTKDFNQFGTFSNNYYAKPINDKYAFATLVNTWANTYYNLSGWQSYTSLDASSHRIVQTITNVNEIRFEYNATPSAKTVSLNQPMTDARGIKYSSGITLQPFSSAVLMKDLNPVLADLTKPVITVFTIPDNYSSLTVPINKFTVVYNKAVTGYILTESASAPLASAAGWTSTVPTSYTFSSLGTKTLYAWSKDAAGTISASASAQVEIQKNLGNTTVYAGTATNSNRIAMPVTITETAQINSISIYHEGGTGFLILGLYSNQNSAPSSRLGITASTTINTTAGWQTVPLTSPVSVNSGQTVWLAWIFEKNPGVRYTTGTPGSAASTSYWPPELPATFGTSTIASNKYSIYCNYLPITQPDVTKPVVTAFSVPTAATSLIVAVTGFTASDNNGVTGYLLTELSTAPLASNPGWSTSAPVSYSFTSAGTKTLYAWAKDAAGNVSAGLSKQLTITLPSNSEISLGNTVVYSNTLKWANQLAMPVTFTEAGLIKSISIYHDGGSGNFLLGVYSDLNGFPATKLGVTASTVVVPTAGWQIVQLSSPVSVVSGQKVWLSWVFQNTPGIRYTAGTPGRAASSNTWVNGMPATFGTSTIASNKYSIYCNYLPITQPDVTKPVVTAFSVPTAATSLIVAVTGFTASDNNGVTGYLLTESSTAPLASNPGWSASAPASYSFASAGTKTLYAWAKDAAGNVSAGLSKQLTITLPSNSEISLGNTVVYSNTLKWVNQLAMPVTFTEAGLIKSISIYHDGGSGNFLLGVYSDLNGFPATKLGVTASTVVVPTAGWQTVQLPSPVSVVSGQKVWLSWVFQNTPGIRYTAGTPGRAASSNTWVNGMPAAFGTSTIASNKYSIYCTYTANTNIIKEAVIPEITDDKTEQILSFENDIVIVENLSDEKSVNLLAVNGFKLYPNPASSFVNVDFEFMPENETIIEIIDINGKKVCSQIIQQTSNRIEINHLKTGLYIIRSTDGKNIAVKKLIVN